MSATGKLLNRAKAHGIAIGSLGSEAIKNARISMLRGKVKRLGKKESFQTEMYQDDEDDTHYVAITFGPDGLESKPDTLRLAAKIVRTARDREDFHLDAAFDPHF